MSTVHSNDLPAYITAESPRGLRRLMYKTNARYGSSFRYFDISHYITKQGKTVHIAWFYKKLKDIEELSGDQ